MDKETQIILKNLTEIFYEQFIKDLMIGKLNLFENKLRPLPTVTKTKSNKRGSLG